MKLRAIVLFLVVGMLLSTLPSLGGATHPVDASEWNAVNRSPFGEQARCINDDGMPYGTVSSVPRSPSSPSDNIIDLNGDGYADIIFSNYEEQYGGPYQIDSYIYWGSAEGYTSTNRTELPTVGAIGNTVSDLNGDGFPDIIFSNHRDSLTWDVNSTIYWGGWSGYTVTHRTELPTHGAQSSSVADLNGDGYLDIVFSNKRDDTTFDVNSVIYWGGADGYTTTHRTELPTHGAAGESVADLDGDGYLDIVFSNRRDDSTYNVNSTIYWGSATGYTTTHRTELPTHGAHDNGVADLNDDGYPDIVFANTHNDVTPNINSTIYWGGASGYTTTHKTELPTHGAIGLSIADLNQDGYQELVFSNATDDSSVSINSVIYWGSASGYSTASRTELPTHNAHGNSVADLDADGFLDIVFSNHRDDAFNYAINSVIYWGSASGYSPDNRTELPTQGAHGVSASGGETSIRRHLYLFPMMLLNYSPYGRYWLPIVMRAS